MTSVISFQQDHASMAIVNSEKPEEKIVISSPMSEASLKGCHPVQNLGAVETYIRRYLWVAALEIVEHDALDAITGSETKEAPKKVDKTVEGIKITDEEQKIPSNEDEQRAFVESMIEFGDSCETEEELKKLWKVNQKTIDSLKSSNKEQYQRLQGVFAELKKSFNKEEK